MLKETSEVIPRSIAGQVAGLLLLLLTGCAKVGTPQGGPVDRDPPFVSSHNPAVEATEVAVDSFVEIAFSELMNQESTENAIFVAPEIETGFDWREATVRIHFEEPLEADRTYVVTVGTGARDLRRNALDRSFTFAFATGKRINQGAISGYVYADHEPANGLHVWAYDLISPDVELGMDRPDYRTQSGRNGEYEFASMSAASYRVIAFEDLNRNGEYDQGEPLALPARDLLVEGDQQLMAGDISLRRFKPTAARLRRVLAVHDRAIRLDFDHAVDAALVEVEFDGLAVHSLHGASDDETCVYVLTDPQEAGRPYPFQRLTVEGIPLEWSEPIRGIGRADRVPPSLIGMFPSRHMALGDTLFMIFSEAMLQSEPKNFWITSDSTDAPSGRWEWRNATTLTFAPAFSRAGDYRLVGSGADLQDRSGLALKDSSVVFDFAVLAESELATLRGEVRSGSHRSKLYLREKASSIGGYSEQTQPIKRAHEAVLDANEGFKIDRILPGTYVLNAFRDLNRNGSFDAGNRHPYVPAEPYYRHRDLVNVSGDLTLHQVDLTY